VDTNNFNMIQILTLTKGLNYKIYSYKYNSIKLKRYSLQNNKELLIYVPRWKKKKHFLFINE